MTSPPTRSLFSRWQLAAFLALGVSGTVGACANTSGPGGLDNGGGPVNDATTVCSPGHEGCPCGNPGQSIACGKIVHDFGNYVSCEMGTSMCLNGAWGACEGTVVYQKSKGPVTNGAGGIRHLANTSNCSDPCDPNGCQQTTGGSGDVPDGSGVLITDGGITLPPTTTYGEAGGDGGACKGLQCQVDWGCPKNSQTSLTGTVFDPVMQNPLYNAYVYIPVDPDPAKLPSFKTGATCDACSGATLDAVAVATTDVFGKFTLNNVPTTALSPNNQIPVVVQMGKWRRVQMISTVPDCQSTPLPPDQTRLPRSMFDGYNNTADIPRMGFASGSADPLQCMMLKMGLDPAEFQLPGTGSRRIDYYVANGLNFNPGGAPSYSKLVGSAATLDGYDVVLLPCEGYEDDGNNAYADNIAAYTLAGGRMFTTHYGYTWLSTPTNSVAKSVNPSTGNPNIFYPVGNWHLNNYSYGTAPGQIDTTLSGGAPFPKGQAFETWMDNLPAPNVGKVVNGLFTINSPRYDVDSINPAYATQWIHHANSPNETFAFTFDTPLGVGLSDAGADGGATACGRVVYTDFHVSTAALNGGNSCTTDSDCGYGATCVGGGKLGTCSTQTCTTVADCNDPNFACSGASPGTCTTKDCTSNATCKSGTCSGLGKGTCGCYANADCSSMGAGTCSGNAPGACTTKNCYKASECSAAGTGTCTGKVGTCGCYSNGDCGTLGAGTCSGNKPGACSTKSCYKPGECGAAGTGTCTGSLGKCGCYSNGDCGTLGAGTCSGNKTGSCSTKTCYANTECGAAGTGVCAGGALGKCGCYSNTDCASMFAGSCSGNKPGTCSAKTCYQASECSAAGTKACSGGALGKCGCYQNSDCASNTCTGGTMGKCSLKTTLACEKNADCGAFGTCTAPAPKAGSCSTATCETGASCTLGGNGVCTGSVAGSCGCNETSDCTTLGAGTCTGNTAGSCSGATCEKGGDCSAGPQTCSGQVVGACGCAETSDCATLGAGTCTGNSPGSCSTATCENNGNCAAAGSGTCTGEVVGACGCNETSDCTTLGAGTCTGNTAGSCSTATCENNGNCAAAGNGTCTGAAAGQCGCNETSDCTTLGAGTCSGNKAGSCSANTCLGNGDCSAGNKTCSGVVSGSCTCSGNSDCPGGWGDWCNGATTGSCVANSCTKVAQCSSTIWGGQERCTGTDCNGCLNNNDCPGNNSYCQGASATGTCTGNSGMSPMACVKGPLSAQESALEFLLLDLTACVQPDNQQPAGAPQPVTTFSPATFTIDFSSTCATGTHARWLEIDWQASIPATATIVFSGQTADPPDSGGLPNYSGVQSVTLATATVTTAGLPSGWDAALIDTACAAGCTDAGTLGAFNTAAPPVSSMADMRLTITLNPTTDKLQAPTLIDWMVKSDCPPSE